LDGLVFNITSHDRTDSDRKYWNMAGQWWAMVRRTYKEFIPDIKAFQSVKDWGRLTDNFLWSSYAVWKDGAIQRAPRPWHMAHPLQLRQLQGGGVPHGRPRQTAIL